MLRMMLPFLLPNSDVSSLTTPSVHVKVQTILYMYQPPRAAAHAHKHALKSQRTNLVHFGHVVHIVSLPQAQGQLSQQRGTVECFISHS